METEIQTLTDLLDERGRVFSPGYATSMVFRYNPEKIKARPFSLKEWDFYQIALGDFVLQLTIGHVSYLGNVSANLINLKTGEAQRFSRLISSPRKKLHMPRNPQPDHTLQAAGKDYSLTFRVRPGIRSLFMKADDTKLGILHIDLTLDAPPENEKMVIATPFKHPKRFYLNYKENFYHVRGEVRFGDIVVSAHPEDTALIDWGRGVWPYRHEWFWGNGAVNTKQGSFGFNIGWGFGDLSHATENMFFWNDKAYKLGLLQVERDEKKYMAPWRFRDERGLFDFKMIPEFDNFTQTKMVFVHTQCHQVFGKYHGTAVLPDGQKIKIDGMRAFCEHAQNRW